ncbi:MAG: fatty acyl-AMP ligase [Microthrixaceae bacterium]
MTTSADTLVDRITRVAATSEAPVTFIDRDAYDSVDWAILHEDAAALAAALQHRGVGEGSHVALMGPTTRDLVTAIQAVWLCGGVLVMLPLPMRMASLDAFVAQTRARIRFSESALVLVDEQLIDFVTPVEGDAPMVALQELTSTSRGGEAAHTAADWKRPTLHPDDLAVLQFTSGSTSDPKGVMLTHRQLLANIDGCWRAAEMTTDDVVVSWLPLYHDMGLIGLLTIPMTTGAGLAQGAPQDFLARPARWMRWVSDLGGTITAGPNFSFALATRSLRRAEGLDLSRLRICLNGAEPIDTDGFAAFLEAGAAFGMPAEAAFPAFGMAELCIAGTFPTPGSGLRIDVVDADRLASEGLAVPVERDRSASASGVRDGDDERATRRLAFLGRAIPGLELRVVDPDGRPLEDRRVGELWIRGSSVCAGYFERPDVTDELIPDGWLRTGDLAYMVDGELVLCGRIKDVIIIGGRNIHPHDIESIVGRVEGVRTGNVIAFGDDGGHVQHLVVVAETRESDVATLAAAIRRVVTDEIGVPPREVVLVEPGTVPKTSSGKLQRAACRDRHRRGLLTPIGT